MLKQIHTEINETRDALKKAREAKQSVEKCRPFLIDVEADCLSTFGRNYSGSYYLANFPERAREYSKYRESLQLRNASEGAKYQEAVEASSSQVAQLESNLKSLEEAFAQQLKALDPLEQEQITNLLASLKKTKDSLVSFMQEASSSSNNFSSYRTSYALKQFDNSMEKRNQQLIQGIRDKIDTFESNLLNLLVQIDQRGNPNLGA